MWQVWLHWLSQYSGWSRNLLDFLRKVSQGQSASKGKDPEGSQGYFYTLTADKTTLRERMNFSSTSIVPHRHGLLKGISTRLSLPSALLCVLIPALIRSHLKRATHSVTDGNKAFSYSQTLLIAFFKRRKIKK